MGDRDGRLWCYPAVDLFGKRCKRFELRCGGVQQVTFFARFGSTVRKLVEYLLDLRQMPEGKLQHEKIAGGKNAGTRKAAKQPFEIAQFAKLQPKFIPQFAVRRE